MSACFRTTNFVVVSTPGDVIRRGASFGRTSTALAVLNGFIPVGSVLLMLDVEYIVYAVGSGNPALYRMVDGGLEDEPALVPVQRDECQARWVER